MSKCEQMSDAEILRQLKLMAVLDNLRCLGCGYEHSCTVKGCAIINQAANRLEVLMKKEGRLNCD